MPRERPHHPEQQPGVLDPAVDLTRKPPLVTPGFHPFADFASFGEEEATMIREGGSDMGLFTAALTDCIAGYLSPRLAAAGVGGGVSRQALGRWLVLSSTGPYDADFAGALRGLTHLRQGVTFPGVGCPMPPQMIIAAMAWVQGQVLLALGNVTDTTTLSGVGGIWMDQLMLQLGIILEPLLAEPVPDARRDGNRDGDRVSAGDAPEPHPYADLAWFGPAEGQILAETAAVLAPAAGGIGSLADMYLLSRKESAPYFRASGGPLAQLDARIPAQLSIALTGWAEMRLMTALNTIAFDAAEPAGEPGPIDELGDPGALARVGRVWMSMLTLKLGTLLGPALSN